MEDSEVGNKEVLKDVERKLPKRVKKRRVVKVVSEETGE
jgi:hypothetical protein